MNNAASRIDDGHNIAGYELTSGFPSVTSMAKHWRTDLEPML